MKKLLVLPVALGAAYGVFAGATYDASSHPGDLVVTVDSEGATMDAAQVTEGVTNIIKRGSGTLTASPISSYEGDFDIELGVYSFGAAGDFGKPGFGTINVRDGASLLFTGTKSGTLSGKTVNLYGQPASGAKGKVVSKKVGGNVAGPGSFKEVRLWNDATFYSDGLRMYWSGGTIDLRGHDLAAAGSGGTQVQLDCTITNGGSVVVSATLMSEGDDGITFAADSADTGKVVLLKNGQLNLKKIQHMNGWTLVCSNGSQVVGNTTRKPTHTDYPQWDGPMFFSGTVGLASFEGGYGQSNSVYNVKGPVSGSGTLKVGPGWLNLHNATNDYTGAVVVKGMSDNQTPSSSNAPVPPGGGGIGVWNGAACFPKASSVTFGKSARFQLMDDVKAELPVFTFNDETYAQSFTGGASADGQRSVSAGIVKTGASTLTLDSPVAVTGCVSVSAGTLKIARRAAWGNCGLREYNIRANLADYNNDIAASTKPWEKTTGTRLTVTDKGISENGPRKMLSKIEAPEPDPNGGSVRHGYWYTGYVWNRSPTNETWQILTDYSNPNISMYLGEDHKSLGFLQQQKLDNGKTNVPVQVVLEPGPTRVDLWLFTWAGGTVSPGLHSKKGLSFLRGPTRPVSDFRVDDATFWAPFVKMADDGTGFLFTTDDNPPEETEVSFVPLPIVKTLEMAAGTTLDLDGNAVFRVGELVGSPTVTNAPYFAVTNGWTLKSSEANSVLTTDGRLAFSDGATFAVDDERHYPRPGNGGRVVARAALGIEGLPESVNPQWRLEPGSDGKSLVLKHHGPGLFILIR